MRRKNQPGCPCCESGDTACGSPCGICADDYITGPPTVVWDSLVVTNLSFPFLVYSGSGSTIGVQPSAANVFTVVPTLPPPSPPFTLFYITNLLFTQPDGFLIFEVSCENGETTCLFAIVTDSGPVTLDATHDDPVITCTGTEITVAFGNWVFDTVVAGDGPYAGLPLANITLDSVTVTYPITPPRPQICCNPCALPKQDMMLSWTNPTLGNGSSTVTFDSGTNIWSAVQEFTYSAVSYTMTWTLRCLSGLVSVIAVVSDGTTSRTYGNGTGLLVVVDACNPLHIRIFPVNATLISYGFTGWFIDE